MDTIRNYIENLFAGLPNKPEVIKAKEELTSMMEDKYVELKNEGKSENEAIGIVISEFGNIDELKAELNLDETAPDVRYVSESEANSFLTSQKKFAHRIAYGVMLCIVSPVLLILLDSLNESSKISLNNDACDAIGTSILLIMIAAAVAVFIISAFSCHKYEYISKEAISLDSYTTSKIKNLKENFRMKFTVAITVGVILCILSVLPLIISGCFIQDNTANAWIFGILTGLLLVIVSIGVYLFVTVGVINGSYNQLLQEEDYTIEHKNHVRKKEKTGNRIDGFYWPLTTLIYLAWSFISMDWHITWIVWPIAAVAYWAITSIISTIKNENK